MTFRAGGGFDTRVGRDHDDAAKRRAEHELAEILGELVVAGVANPDTNALLKETGGAGAAAVVEQLWPKPPSDSAEHNDLAVAFAWLKQWDKAVAELAASETAPGASDADRERAAGNRDVVRKAREKATN